MSDVQIIDPFVAETGRDGGGFVFGFGEEDGEFLHGGHGDVTAVVPRQEGFAFEVEEEEGGGHVGGRERGGDLCRIGGGWDW